MLRGLNTIKLKDQGVGALLVLVLVGHKVPDLGY